MQYSLRQLFGEDLTIVIPDMQRDYCWGSDGISAAQPTEKVTQFVQGLIRLYHSGVPSTLGLLYGYENPPESKHIQIIDGQQRLTTLFLLIGMLYRRTPRHDIRQLLISDYELIDDREPRLLYQVRSEAMYFLSDLVTHFFLNRDGRLSQLESSPWFYDAYKSDISVCSFIGAIRCIDAVLEEAKKSTELDFDKFADYMLDSVLLMYHDLGSRRHAESMFVTINTTIEPLTMAQRYKSMLLSAADETVVGKWDAMEQWAWTNRDKAVGKLQTSDERLQQLLELWTAYSTDKNEVLTVERFGSLFKFFGAFSTLASVDPWVLGNISTRQEYLFVVLPTVKYILRWNLNSRQHRQITRIASLLRNILRYTKVSQSGNDTASAIRTISRMPTSDVLSLLEVGAQSADKILNSEELAKLRCIRANSDIATELTNLIARAEAHPMLNGKVERVLSWSEDKQTGRIDIDKLRRYVEGIYALWGEDIDENPKLDLLRRALLTLRQGEYPIVRRGDTNLSLCWNYYDWQRLMANNPNIIRRMVERVGNNPSPQSVMDSMIDKFDDQTYPYYFIIKDGKVLANCLHRSLTRPSKPFLGFLRPADNRSVWYVDQHQLKADAVYWKDIRTYGTKCLYTDHRTYNLAIDIYFTPGLDMPYRIEIFSRRDADRNTKQGIDITKILESVSVRFKFDKKRGRFYANQPDSASAANLMNQLLAQMC